MFGKFSKGAAILVVAAFTTHDAECTKLVGPPTASLQELSVDGQLEYLEDLKNAKWLNQHSRNMVHDLDNFLKQTEAASK